MHLDSEKLDNGIIKVNLSGRMDLLGTQAIEKKLTALIASQNGPILVDLSEVDFLSSSAIRILIFSSKDLSERGGRMVLYFPKPMVREVLQAAGVPTLIPVFHDFRDATDALTSNKRG